MKVSAGQYMPTLCLDMSMLCLGDVEFLSSSLFPVKLSRPAGQGSMYGLSSAPDWSSRPTRESGTSGAPRSNELATCDLVLENPIVLENPNYRGISQKISHCCLRPCARAALAPRPPPPRQSRRPRARCSRRAGTRSLVSARGRRALFVVHFVLAAWCGRAN